MLKKKFLLLVGLPIFLLAANFLVQDAKAKMPNHFMEDILHKDIINFFDFSNITMTKEPSLTPAPQLISNFKNGINKLEFNVQLPTYDRFSYKFLVAYDVAEDENLTEIFRYRVSNSGRITISDSKLLGLLKNNKKLLFRIESYKIKNGLVTEKIFSENSDYYYTPKDYKLVIKEDDNIVYNNTMQETTFKVFDKLITIDFSKLKKYEVDKYFSYENSKIIIDGKESKLQEGKLQLPYMSKVVVIELAKVENQWSKVNINYPSFLKNNNKQIYIKNASRFSDFYNSNSKVFKNLDSSNKNYSFFAYYIDNIDIKEYKGIINSDISVSAIYNTKIFVTNDSLGDEFTLKTGEKLSKLDLSAYQKADYNIVSYTIIDNETKEEKNITSLDDWTVDNSVTIIPNYEVKKYKIMLRQDDYNKRFGKVDSSIENKDIEWSSLEPIGNLLDAITPNIKAGEGYSLEYRVNRKTLAPETLIKEDTLVEIYFKKKEEDWVTIKFVGEGIDKFLSDGQEVLAGKRIDTINLPTIQGSNKEFLGWLANTDYQIEINEKIIDKSKDSILKNIDLPHVLTTKGESLTFTAVYLETYKINIEDNNQGKVALINKSTNVLDVRAGTSLKKLLESNKLIFLPKSHFKFSHFTSTLPVTVRGENGEKRLVKIGDKISLEEFYSIIPDKNLTFIANFVFIGGVEDDQPLSIYSQTNNIFNVTLEKNYNNSLDRALGPLNFLK